MQGIPDWAWIEQLLRVADTYQMLTFVKAASLVGILAFVVFISRELVVKPALHWKKKRNGGTEYDQLARQSASLAEISQRLERLIQVNSVAFDAEGLAHREQAERLDRIADVTRETAHETALTMRSYFDKLMDRIGDKLRGHGK